MQNQEQNITWDKEDFKQESYIVNNQNLDNLISCEYIEFDNNKPIPEIIIPDQPLEIGNK